MINKVLITKEARFDYEEVVVNRLMPSGMIKKELEEFFANKNYLERYFATKFYDEESEKMLLLFLRKGAIFKAMQVWKLAGICEINDYNENLEERGFIKSWLDTYIVA